MSDVKSAEKLRAIRKGLGFSQATMATQLGISLRAYQSLEAGESAVRDIHILAAERVALSIAVLKSDPMIVGPEVRSDALDLTTLIRGDSPPRIAKNHHDEQQSAVYPSLQAFRGHTAGELKEFFSDYPSEMAVYFPDKEVLVARAKGRDLFLRLDEEDDYPEIKEDRAEFKAARKLR